MATELQALRRSHDALLTACKAQHEAIDILFAMLIARSRPGEPFYPSQSGQPWAAMEQGNAAIAHAESV